jgi:hypothetical protein
MTTQSAVSTTHQSVAVDQVTGVTVTDVIQVSDEYVREIRVFGQPDGAGGVPVFILRISSSDAALVELTTPTLKF